MNTGLIADSHDRIGGSSASTVGLIEDLAVENVLHAGAMGLPPVIRLVYGCGMLLHGVYGNGHGEEPGSDNLFEYEVLHCTLTSARAVGN